MDTDFPVELRAAFDVIDSLDVITFLFVTAPQRLLFDTRHDETDGPLLWPAPCPTRLGQEMLDAITGAGYHSLWECTC